jgi:hypothetical protein
MHWLIYDPSEAKRGQWSDRAFVVSLTLLGEAVTAGDVLLEIETDKAGMDVEATEDGILAKILASHQLGSEFFELPIDFPRIKSILVASVSRQWLTNVAFIALTTNNSIPMEPRFP